jgi:hypothetical protein
LSKISKRKWKDIRKEFKKDIINECSQNKAFSIMIIETYTASQCRKHIMQIWALLGHNHKEAYKDYCNKLMGKSLTGRSEIVRNLYFANKELYEKYSRKIPECYAMGEALGVALRFANGGK